MSSIEIVAVIFGFLCVFLTIKESIWCWPTGLIQVFLYVFIFYDAKLYSDVILHIIYVFLQFYGWYFWLHGGKKRTEAKLSEMSTRWRFTTLSTSIICTLLLGYYMSNHTDASFPYPDAFTTVFSLAAQWLLTRKKLESWYFWIAVDVVAIGVYYAKGLNLTAGLYMAFLGMAVAGLFRWKKSFAALSDTQETPELEPCA